MLIINGNATNQKKIKTWLLLSEISVSEGDIIRIEVNKSEFLILSQFTTGGGPSKWANCIMPHYKKVKSEFI
jgi:hypothetical protein